MMDRCEPFSDCSTTIPLLSLKVSYLYTIPCAFYDSPNEQNWVCKLCTFSQIWSHIIIPNELVINWDHTGVNYKPVNNCTIATEGSKQITVTWLGDKRQLTAGLVASSTATNNIYWENTTLSSNYEIPRRLRYHFYSKPLSKLEDNRSYNEDFGSLH